MRRWIKNAVFLEPSLQQSEKMCHVKMEQNW